MSSSSRPRVLVLAKKSALQAHKEHAHPEQYDRVEMLLAQRDVTVARMEGAAKQHAETLIELEAALAELACDARVVTASALDEFKLFSPNNQHNGNGERDPNAADLVVTIGGDGTLLAASHAIGDVPVLGINSAPDFSVGFFCGGRMGAVKSVLQRALSHELPEVRLTRMQAHLDDRLLTRRVLNEALVCAGSPAATSRYLLEHRGVVEEQKSSGMWVGPAAGSTAAQRSAGGRVLPLRSNKLQFVVREPYMPAGQTLSLPRGLVAFGEELRLRMKSGDGRIFIDGPHEVYPVTIGDTLRFAASAEPLRLLGVSERRGWRIRKPPAGR